jgi:hypothetical protein
MVTVRTTTARASTRIGCHELSLAAQSERSPRCERVAGRSMLVVGAGREPLLVARGRSWPTRLLYLSAVRLSGRWFVSVAARLVL